ncbi:hypothetical protein [Corynebacterium meridianum]|nr:hypothetical protein [Corynebacterium meridianum]MCK7677428.1 hypothetical protein [Corynebacterium meridianum]
MNRVLDNLRNLLNRLFNSNGVIAALGIGSAIAIIAGIAHFVNVTMLHR